jgi:hypothetical protein
MKPKHVVLKVVASAAKPGMLSLRGPKGRNHNDDIRKHITGVFEEGDEVVLLRKADFEKLFKAQRSRKTDRWDELI